jgi:ParB family chromosome partitioning protein
MLSCTYEVVAIDGDYAHLRRNDIEPEDNETKLVARALLPLKADLQLDAASLIVKQGLSVRQTEALAKRLSNPKEERKPTNDELIAESYGRLAAQELSDKIGRTCRIVSGKKKGRIELDYYGIDDLNDLLEALAAIKRRKNGGE